MVIRTGVIRRTLILPGLLALAPFLMGMGLHETKDAITDARSAAVAAQPNVTRYGMYEYAMASALITAAQAEYDEMDYATAECFAKKAARLAAEATTKQSF
jgi:hypothetical protein